MEMSITRGLSELKLLDKRIDRKIGESEFIGYKVKDKFSGKFKNEEDMSKTIKANLASVKDLIERRNEIKSKIVMSNAVETVNIGGKKYTVAEAIEKKTSVEYEKYLLSLLKKRYNDAYNAVERNNAQVKDSLDSIIKSMGENSSKESVNSVSESYVKQHEATIVDPLNIRAVIENLETEIENFESEVDHILSESNALNKIEVSD